MVAVSVLLVLAAAPALGKDPFLRHTAAVETVRQSGPAVVNITTEQFTSSRNPRSSFSRSPLFDRFFRDFFEPRLTRRAQNLGSGVVIDREGHILTNEHVISGAQRIRVSMADYREFEATVLGADPNNDIAVLKITAEAELPWIEPFTADDIMVGEPVIAIGNPFGLSNTVTTGVISAVNRSLRTQQRTFHGFLQTDASINPGNSGGPLLNARGQLVGINTAVYDGGQGIGFAIPIDVAIRVVNQLIEHGEVAPVWLGMDFQDLDPQLATALGLTDRTRGALVNRVRPDSPAERAGMKRGDVVSHIEQRPVLGARSFFEMLESVTVDQELEADLWRGGKRMQVILRAEPIPSGLVNQLVEELLGLTLEKQGGAFIVRQVRAGSGAQRIGVQEGDFVLGINGRVLDDNQELRRSILELRGRSRALVVVQRGSSRYHITIPLV